MNVTVTGCRDPQMERELVNATRFFGRFLLSRKMLPNISVEIMMKTTIPDLGSCAITYYNDWYKPREFEIELRRHRSLKNTLKTLAHEMVHLKQFAKCELNAEQTRWHRAPINTDDMSYMDYPWEQEANDLEHILYDVYTAYLNIYPT